jgi:hypothetical protein
MAAGKLELLYGDAAGAHLLHQRTLSLVQK